MEYDSLIADLEDDQGQEEVIDIWLKHQKTKEDKYFCGWEILQDMVMADPELLWKITLKFIERDVSDEALYLYAAGPLEDLLSEHGPKFIDRVELEARRHPQFRKLLGGVWMGDKNKDVTKRVEFWQKAIPKDE